MEPASPFLSLFRGQWRLAKESVGRDKSGRVNYYAILSFKETSMIKLEYSTWCNACTMFCVKVFPKKNIDWNYLRKSDRVHISIFFEYNLSKWREVIELLECKGANISEILESWELMIIFSVDIVLNKVFRRLRESRRNNISCNLLNKLILEFIQYLMDGTRKRSFWNEEKNRYLSVS